MANKSLAGEEGSGEAGRSMLCGWRHLTWLGRQALERLVAMRQWGGPGCLPCESSAGDKFR